MTSNSTPGVRRTWRSRVSDEELALLGEPLVSAETVAKFLGVDRSTVYRMAGKRGGIPCVKVGECRKFRPADVRAYLERQTLCDVAVTRAEKLLRSVS